MKRLFRTSIVQSTLALLLSAYIGATLATMRWRFENRGPAAAAVAEPGGIIGCFWHGRIALAVVCRRVLKSKPRRVLISLSPDGEFIAKAVKRLGFPAIRGGAASLRGDTRRKGGVGAFIQALRFLAGGGVIAVTPDGPRGPVEVMPEGPVLLAKASGAPVFLFGLAASPALTLGSWDKARLPVPFSRGCVVFDGPLFAPKDADEPAIEALRADWQTRLSAAQGQAEAILAGKTH
jgi:lysophospholipid acyltransferase (LPLAT)-like uncharacterized protein